MRLIGNLNFYIISINRGISFAVLWNTITTTWSVYWVIQTGVRQASTCSLWTRKELTTSRTCVWKTIRPARIVEFCSRRDSVCRKIKSRSMSDSITIPIKSFKSHPRRLANSLAKLRMNFCADLSYIWANRTVNNTTVVSITWITKYVVVRSAVNVLTVNLFIALKKIELLFYFFFHRTLIIANNLRAPLDASRRTLDVPQHRAATDWYRRANRNLHGKLLRE